MSIRILKATRGAIVTFVLPLILFAIPVAHTADLGARCFLGDSLAYGMAISVKLPHDRNLAKEGSFTLAAIEQMQRCPRGSVAIVSDGTNDASRARSEEEFAPRYAAIVDRVVKAADERGLMLVWYAPPKVRFSWDRYSQVAADTIKSRLAGSYHRYVETRDIRWGVLRSADGVHFTIPRGYLAFYNAGMR